MLSAAVQRTWAAGNVPIDVQSNVACVGHLHAGGSALAGQGGIVLAQEGQFARRFRLDFDDQNGRGGDVAVG